LKRTYDISCRKSLHHRPILPETGLEPAQSCDYQALNLFQLGSPHLTRTGNTLEVLASLFTYVQTHWIHVLPGFRLYGPMLPFFCPPDFAMKPKQAVVSVPPSLVILLGLHTVSMQFFDAVRAIGVRDVLHSSGRLVEVGTV